MKINDIDISTIGCKCLGYTISNSAIKSNYDTYNHVFYNSEVEEKDLTFNIYINADNREQTENNQSLITSMLYKNPIITFNDNDLIYDCIYDSSSIKTLNPDRIIISYKMKAITKGKLKTVNITNDDVVNYIGTYPCYYIAELKNTTSDDIANVLFNDITIDFIYGNKTLIINGIDKTITIDGVNQFGLTDVKSFPKLNTGNNIITINSNDINVAIKYNPIYI